MITAKRIHAGQYQRYGDWFEVYEVTSDAPITEQDVIEWSKENLSEWRPEDLPHHDEWSENITYGGPRWGDPEYYFTGYYTIRKQGENTYEVSICRPYAD